MAFARRTEAVTKNHVNLVARIVSGVIPDGDPAHHTVAYGSLKEPVRADAGKQFAFIYIFHDTTNISRTIPIEGIRLPGGITLEHTDTTKKAIKVTFPSGIPRLTEQLQALLSTHTIPVVEESTRSRSTPRQRPAGGGAPSPTAAAAAASPRRPRSSSVARTRHRSGLPPPSVAVPAATPGSFSFATAATGAGNRTAPARSASARRQRPSLGIADPRAGKPPRARSRTPVPARRRATRSASPPCAPKWRGGAAVAPTPAKVTDVFTQILNHLQRAVMPWHDTDIRAEKDAALLTQLGTLQTQLRKIEDPAAAFTCLQGQLATFAVSSKKRTKTHLEEIAKLLGAVTNESDKNACIAKFCARRFDHMVKPDLRAHNTMQTAIAAAKTGGASAAFAPDDRK